MRSSFPRLVLLLLCLGLACTVPQILAKRNDRMAYSMSGEQKSAAHALNRLTFGARPSDVQEVMAMGVDRWIELQLHPEKIDDKEVEARLAPFRTLRMSTKEIVEDFPDRQMVKQVADGRRPMPSDPARRAVYQVQVARLEEKQQIKEGSTAATALPTTPVQATTAEDAITADGLATGATESLNGSRKPETVAASSSETGVAKVTPQPTSEQAEARRRAERLYTDLNVQSLLDLAPGERYKKVLAMSVDERVAFADQLRGAKGQQLLQDLDPKQKEVLQAMNNPPAVVVSELSQARLLRAIYSKRQLEEVSRRPSGVTGCQYLAIHHGSHTSGIGCLETNARLDRRPTLAVNI